MSTSDGSDLQQRALAAMRDAARHKAEQDEQTRQEAARRQGEQTHLLITSAISKLEEILDQRTSPADWKAITWNAGADVDRYVDVAYTSLLGLTIKTDVNFRSGSPNLLVQMPYGKWAILTLENLGKALKAWKGSLWPPEPWPPKQYRA
jgi:hypothetical protein